MDRSRADVGRYIGTVFRNNVSLDHAAGVKRGSSTRTFLMPRTKQRTPELRDRVLAAAVDLLAEEGAAGLTARSLGGPGGDVGARALRAVRGQVRGGPRALLRGLPAALRANWRRWRRRADSDGGPVDAGRRLPPIRPGQPRAGRGHVLATVHGFLARARRAGGDELGPRPDRGPGTPVHRRGPTPRRRDGRGARLRRVDPGHGVRRGRGPARDLHRVDRAALAARPSARCSTGSAPVPSPCRDVRSAVSAAGRRHPASGPIW